MQSNATSDSRISLDGSETRRLARELILRGEVIAFLTDTLYGLGADPFNPSAVKKVKTLKGSDEDKPILVLVSDDSQVDCFFARRTHLLNIFRQHAELASITVVERAKPNVLRELTGGTENIGLRIPSHERVRDFLRECGGTLTATSANPTGKAPAKNAVTVGEYFGERISLIVDSGVAQSSQPSTIVDISNGTVRLIREGTIAVDHLANVLHACGYKGGVEAL